MHKSVHIPTGVAITDTYPSTRGLIDATSKVPMYHQLYVLLRNRIANRSVLAGELLPGELELCANFGVSRITAKRALDELASSGLVVREQGRGTRVLAQQSNARLNSGVEGWFENQPQPDSTTQIRVLEFDYRPASDDIARALQIPCDSLIQRAVRVRFRNKVPLSYLVTYVPESVGRQYSVDDLSNTALLTLLENLGIEVAAARQSLSASLAKGQMATALEVPEGNPLIEAHRVIEDHAGLPVEFIRAYYRPDQYRFETGMVRVPHQSGRRWSTASV